MNAKYHIPKAVMETLHELGYSSLRDWQVPVVSALQKGADTVVIVKTGGGKTLLFTLLARMDKNGITLVISPLRALQQDQVASLRKQGVQAALLNSDLTKSARQKILNHISDLELLFLAPEQLRNQDLRQALDAYGVANVVLDEAHFLPQNEGGFRKAYGEIGEFIDALPNHPQILACTATATKKERERIKEALRMDHPQEFVFPVRRENLQIICKEIRGDHAADTPEALYKAVEGTLKSWNKKGSVIIYCPTKRRVKELSKWLKSRKIKCTKYTGGMKDKNRRKNQRKFMSGKVPVMIATTAFGVGINKPDVHLLIHAGMPLSFSEYVQEIGRAGRDGKKSQCVLFYSPSEYDANKQILSYNHEPQESRKNLEEMNNYIRSDKCCWRQIEVYLQENDGENCKHCSNCAAKR